MKKTALITLLVFLFISLPAQLAGADMKKGESVSIFLITSGLPHYTMIIKKMWDDPKLSLSDKQKKILLQIREETMKNIMGLKPKIIELETKIKEEILDAKDPSTLYNDLTKLSKLKEANSRTHLKCIYETKKVLTKKQIEVINEALKYR